MSSLNFSITKSAVYDEVSKTTAYTGKKATQDEGAFERVALMEEDKEMLSRFWNEAAQSITEMVKPFLGSVTNNSTVFSATLSMSSSWDQALAESLKQSIENYFAATLIGGWCQLTKKDEVEAYAQEAAAILLDIKSKLWYRKKPTRPTAKIVDIVVPDKDKDKETIPEL